MSPGQIHPIYQRNSATRSGTTRAKRGQSDAFPGVPVLGSLLSGSHLNPLVLSIGELTNTLSHLERVLEHASSRHIKQWSCDITCG